jgi:hypothetical protein
MKLDVVGEHITGPAGIGLIPAGLDVGIMVAGDDCNLLGRSQRPKPVFSFLELRRQTQMGEITGNGDVIGDGLPNIMLQRGENAVQVFGPAVQLPSQVPVKSFVEKMPHPDIVQT